MTAVLARRDSFAANWQDDGQAAWLEQAGVRLYREHGRIVSARAVEVTGKVGTTTTLTARHAVVVATGSGALVAESLRDKGVSVRDGAEAAAAAAAAGLRIRAVDHDLAATAGSALHADGYRGHARMVVGPDVAERLHAATIAVVGEVPVRRERDTSTPTVRP